LRRPVEPNQYSSRDFTDALADHDILASVGSVGDALDCDDAAAGVVA
jgi:hypothetical protein